LICKCLQVGDIAEQLKIAFKQRILEKDWLDETTKNRTVEKVGENTVVEITVKKLLRESNFCLMCDITIQ